MPIFRIQVFYRLGVLGKWSNVYHAEAAAMGDVIAAFDAAMTAPLLSLIDTTVTLEKYLFSDVVGTQFSTLQKDLPGTSTGSGDLLPLFNSVKAYVVAGVFGKPDYKFFKGFVTESLQTAGNLTSGAQTYVEDALQQGIDDMIIAGVPLTSKDGTNWAGVTVQQAVQMRQMHRKRKRVVTPP